MQSDDTTEASLPPRIDLAQLLEPSSDCVTVSALQTLIEKADQDGHDLLAHLLEIALVEAEILAQEAAR